MPQDEMLLGRDFATAMVVFHEAVGRLLGLSAVERKCLDVLRQLGPVTAGAIGRHTGLTTGAVTGLMDRLENAGYVRRERDPHDRRKILVHLLPSERMDTLLAAAFGPFAADMTDLAAHYDAAEQQAIADWVRRTTQILVTNSERILKQAHSAPPPEREPA